MKKVSVLILVLVALVCSHTISFAHSGRTDSSGGHHDSFGDYHYHHGYSAHYHIDGECPYDFHDKTNTHSGSTANSTTGSYKDGSTNKNSTTSTGDVAFDVFSSIMLLIPLFLSGIFFILPFINLLAERFLEKSEKSKFWAAFPVLLYALLCPIILGSMDHGNYTVTFALLCAILFLTDFLLYTKLISAENKLGKAYEQLNKEPPPNHTNKPVLIIAIASYFIVTTSFIYCIIKGFNTLTFVFLSADLLLILLTLLYKTHQTYTNIKQL